MLAVPGGRPAEPARRSVIRPRPKWAAGPRRGRRPGPPLLPVPSAPARPDGVAAYPRRPGAWISRGTATVVTRPLTLAEIAHLPAVTYLVPPGGRWGWAGPRPTTSPAPGSSPARSSGPGKPGWSPLPGCSSSSACPSPAPAAQQARTVGHHEPRPGSRQSSASADLRDEGAGVRPAGAPRPGTTGYDSIRRKAPGRPPRRLAQPPHA